MKNILRTLSIFMLFLFVLFVHNLIQPDNDPEKCYYYLAIYKYQCKGVVTLIDTVVDKSGVGVYVRNYSLCEGYKFYSDSLKKIAWVGDSIFKFKDSIYGYIKRYNGEIIYLSLLDKREECDILTDEQKEEIIKTSGVNFKK